MEKKAKVSRFKSTSEPIERSCPRWEWGCRNLIWILEKMLATQELRDAKDIIRLLSLMVHMFWNICIYFHRCIYLHTHTHSQTHTNITPHSHQVKCTWIAIDNIMLKIFLSVRDTVIVHHFREKFCFPLCRKFYLGKEISLYFYKCPGPLHFVFCWGN